MRVCIATPEIAGPIFTGGVGTFYASLAQSLVRHGHEVTVAYALGDYSEQGPIGRWVEHYRRLGVRLVPVREGSVGVAAPLPRRRAYAVYEWLRARQGEFDVVHVPEWQGVGYYALTAKRQGLAFAGLDFVVVCHSPTMYLAPNHLNPIDDTDNLELDFLERRSVEQADVLVSPSAFLLEWMQAEGWELPPESYVHPLILPPEHRSAAPADVRTNRRLVSELVFFGRLDVLKGLDTFCAALDRLALSGPQPKAVAFLGRESVIEGTTSRAYLEKRAASWPFPCFVRTELGTSEALAYLRGEGRIAVTASRIENSPNTVYECLGSRVPFVVSAVGGVPELIAEADRREVLFAPRPDELADLLRRLLREGARVARPAIDFDDAEQRWVGLHETLLERRASAPVEQPAAAGRDAPLVSVCLTHFNRPRLLEQALASLAAQDYPSFEVVLVDDASTDSAVPPLLERLQPEFEQRGWRIVRHDRNRYLGAARNTAARHARGELLLFMDDDNVAFPDELSRLVAVQQRTGADILTCAADVFSHTGSPRDGERPAARHVPLGAALGVGLYNNCFGDANALVRRDTYEQTGGFSEDWGIGYEDWEFFARASLQGHSLEPVPEPLYWYRSLDTNMARATNRTANLQRVLRPYFDHTTPALHGLLRIIQARLDAQPATIEDWISGGGMRARMPAQQRFDRYWDSTSWRLTRPLRQLNRRRHHLPPESRPRPRTDAEIEQLIAGITASLSWRLTSPIRAAGVVKNRLLRH